MEQEKTRTETDSFLQRCYKIGKTPIHLWKTDSTKNRSSRSNQTQRTVNFELHGRISSGARSLYAVDGEDFDFDDNTWVIGVMKNGSLVSVKGIIRSGGKRYAKKITILS